MPAGLVSENDGMLAGRDLGGDLGKVKRHRLAVAMRQHQGRALAVTGTDGAKYVGGSRALIGRCAGAAAASGPAAGDLVLLADPGFIGEPDLYVDRSEAFRSGDFRQLGGEVFLNASTAPSFCA